MTSVQSINQYGQKKTTNILIWMNRGALID